MPGLDELRERIPEVARDLRVNLQTVLQEGGALSPAQRWGIAVACGHASRNRELAAALLAEAKGKVDAAVIEDAQAAAALMGMNNVYYRFRHFIARDEYKTRPARLRMQRIARPATSKVDFELFCLAVSAVNGCESCLRAHEKVALEGGLTEDHVNDAVRIAATIHGAAVALEL